MAGLLCHQRYVSYTGYDTHAGHCRTGYPGQDRHCLFMLFSNNQIGILAAMGSVWVINIIFPAVLGSLLILNVKLFRKNNVNTVTQRNS